MKICDLHTHSVYSDGTFTPTRIISSATALGLSAVALCDHNTVDGLPEFLTAAQEQRIRAVPGCEFSVDYVGTELHLLALFIPEGHFDAISHLMEDVNRRKDRSNRDLIFSLNRAGYKIDYERIKSATPNGKFNRAHIAAELTRLGYTASRNEAFQTLLDPKTGHYREPERLTFFEMLDFIRSIDAVPVLAHPFLNLSEDQLRALLPLAKSRGLVGMECRYSNYDAQTTALSLALARQFHLKPSGGSDFHGANKPDIRLGSGRGDLRVPLDWLEALAPE